MNCQICGSIPTCICTEVEFIDGKVYDLICWTCANVPKTYEYDHEGEIIPHKHKSRFHLSDIKDLMQDGWTQEEAKNSIDAVKKKLGKLPVLPKFLVLDKLWIEQPVTQEVQELLISKQTI